MIFIDKDNTITGYVIYSKWGLMSHAIMNQYGVTFICNPKTTEGEAVIYETEELARKAMAEKCNKFYDQVTPAVLISKVESYE